MSSTPNIDFLTNELARLGLDTKGNKAALEKRLKRAKKRVINDLLVAESLQLANERQAIIDAKPQPFDYYLICDVEATCLDNSGFDYGTLTFTQRTRLSSSL